MISEKTEKKINLLLLCFFPIFIVLITELNHLQRLSKLFTFVTSKWPIFFFDIFIVGLLFITILFIVKKAYLAMLLNGLLFYGLSCVEYYKYKASGTHLMLSDLAMTGNLSDMTKFTHIEISLVLVINLLLLIGYIVLVHKQNIIVHMKKQYILSIVNILLLAILILPSKVSSNIYQFFHVDVQDIINTFDANKKFKNNYFITFLTETTTGQLSKHVKKPETYSKDSIYDLVDNSTVTEEDNFIKPDILFIMSESYADFRCFDNEQISDDIYKEFDEVAKQGVMGECIVPTFGGYTVRTEFELLFGLPVHSLNDPYIPHKLLKEREDQPTFANFFNSLGYNTTYIHPFSGSFYDRDEVYNTYDFDQMIFLDDLDVPVENFRNFTNDETVFEQLKKQLTEKNEPHFIFTTTMQNHTPYIDEERGDYDELDNYLEGIKETNKELKEFVNWLETYDRPVLLFFVGDHFPFFSPQSNVYEELGVNENNNTMLYHQKYILWNNYGIELDSTYANEVSTFYIPYMVSDIINAPKSKYMNFMLEKMKERPIYSQAVSNSKDKDESLYLLTYDRIFGDLYSFN